MSRFPIPVESLPAKLLLVLCIVVVAFLTVLAAKWNIANAISTRADSKELADLAVRLAPDDPQTRYAAAVIYDKTFEQADAARSLAEFQSSVDNSPNHFILWLALSQSKFRSGDDEGAKNAGYRALELAPNYASVHWAYGNLLFRSGDASSLTYIRNAVEKDAKYRFPAVSLAMNTYQNDVARVISVFGDSPEILVAVAQHFALGKNYAAAQNYWMMVPSEQRRSTFREQALAMSASALAGKQYRLASILLEDGGQPFGKLGEVSDGGFENGVKVRGAAVFEWQIADGNEPQIAISNTIKKSGSNSLLLQFNSMEAAAFRQVSQVVAVEPGNSYLFTTSYRTELKASATLKFVITDIATGTEIASTQTFDATADWSTVSARFVVPASTDAVTISLARADCKATICPINGKVWLDDISLTK